MYTEFGREELFGCLEDVSVRVEELKVGRELTTGARGARPNRSTVLSTKEGSHGVISRSGEIRSATSFYEADKGMIEEKRERARTNVFEAMTSSLKEIFLPLQGGGL